MSLVSLTVTIMDMLTIRVKKSQLQLLSCAALLVACKHRNSKRLNLARILSYLYTAGTRETLLAWEKLILANTQFSIPRVVPHDFLSHLLSLYSHIIHSPLSYVSHCCSKLLSLACMDPNLSTFLPSIQASAALYLVLETEVARNSFLTNISSKFCIETDKVLQCAMLFETVLISTIPDNLQVQEKKKNNKEHQDSPEEKLYTDPISTPQKSQFVVNKTYNTSTPKKSLKIKFPSESSENKENDDSAIFNDTSMFETLSISSPPSSSSSRQSSTKSSPDSGASVSSHRARIR